MPASKSVHHKHYRVSVFRAHGEAALLRYSVYATFGSNWRRQLLLPWPGQVLSVSRRLQLPEFTTNWAKSSGTLGRFDAATTPQRFTP